MARQTLNSWDTLIQSVQMKCHDKLDNYILNWSLVAVLGTYCKLNVYLVPDDYFRFECTNIYKKNYANFWVKFHVFCFEYSILFHNCRFSWVKNSISSVIMMGIWVALLAQYCYVAENLHYCCIINSRSICKENKSPCAS